MKNKKKLGLFIVIALVVVVGVIIFCLLMKQPETLSTEYSENEQQENEQEDTIVHNGKEYRYNNHLSNYLFMGIDTRDDVSTYETQADAGQADAIYLVSYDRVECTITCIAIPRDTLTSIHVYGVDGTDMGTTVDHINLQYAFGDGKKQSCLLMEESVSNMLYGIPIQGYYSMNMDGISVAIGALGSVEVVVPDDSWSKIDDTYQKGTTVTITGENAERLVRYRDTKEDQSAIERMNRQKVLVRAIAAEAQKQVAKDAGVIVDIQDVLKPYTVTNIGNDVFAKLAEAKLDSATAMIDVPGTGVAGTDFDEYHIDEDALYELILELFYEEVPGEE